MGVGIDLDQANHRGCSLSESLRWHQPNASIRAMQFWKKLEANLYWGYRALIAQPLRRLLEFDSSNGLQKFLSNYAPEGLIPLTAEDHQVLLGASRCIHCGLCDSVALPGDGPFHSVSLLPVASAAATPHLLHLEGTLHNLQSESLERAEAVCPTKVPLRALASYLQRKLFEAKREMT